MKKFIYLSVLTIVLSVFTTVATSAATPNALKNINKTDVIKISKNSSQSQIDFLKFKRLMNSFLDNSGESVVITADDGTTHLVKTSLVRKKLKEMNNVGATAVESCWWAQIKFDYY